MRNTGTARDGDDARGTPGPAGVSAVPGLGGSAEWLRVALPATGDAVITTDAHGRVTFLNPVAQKLTGWTQEEAISVPLERIFHIVSEETRAPVENPALRALREGVAVGLADNTLLIARDGTARPIGAIEES